MSTLRLIPGSPDLVRFMVPNMPAVMLGILGRLGQEETIRGIEADVWAAERSWCLIGDKGPVFLVAASRFIVLPGVELWYLQTEAASRHARACIRLWRRAATELLAEFGAVRADVPAYVPPVRRMQRYGFVANAPADIGGGTVVCRCGYITDPAVAQAHPDFLTASGA